MSKEEFIMTIWTEDQYICISVLPSDEAGPNCWENIHWSSRRWP